MHKSILFLCLGVSLIVFSQQSAPGTVVYREIFPNIVTGNETLGPEGWSVHSGVGLLAPNQINSPSFSAPANLPAINSFPTISTFNGQATGYAFNGDADGIDYLFSTSEFLVRSNVWDVTSITWRQGNQNANTARVAVQVGGQWYASQQTFSNDGTNNGILTAASMSLPLNTATWRQLDFTPGVSLALGAPVAALPSGDISGFGYYVDNKTAQLRLDSYTIEATPHVVLYREIFPNNTTFNIINPAASADTAWRVHQGSGTLDTTWLLANNTLDTSSTAANAINSNPAYAPLDNRSYLWNGSSSISDYLMWTDEYSVDVSDVAAIQWWQNNGSSADNIRIALEVDGGWFVSNASFANAADTPTQMTLDLLDATWQSLDFIAGSQLALGAPAALSLPDGTITGFGWYSLTRNSTLRLDSFTLVGFAEEVAVPEPSSLVLFALCGGLVCIFRRVWCQRRG